MPSKFSCFQIIRRLDARLGKMFFPPGLVILLRTIRLKLVFVPNIFVALFYFFCFGLTSEASPPPDSVESSRAFWTVSQNVREVMLDRAGSA